MNKFDPSTVAFNEVFNAVSNGAAASGDVPKGTSAWPVLAFLGFIITAPYLISKLVGQVMTTAVEECKQSHNNSKCIFYIDRHIIFPFDTIYSKKSQDMGESVAFNCPPHI